MKNYYLAFSALVLSILSADTNKILIEDLSLQGNINVSRNEIFYIIRLLDMKNKFEIIIINHNDGKY